MEDMSSSIPDKNFEGGEEITARHQVVLDGDLSKERLLSLIRLGREEEALDYKRSYDLTGTITKDKVEMARDVVAMANTSGGYVLLGVDENRLGTAISYNPVGIPEGHLSALDIDKLKPQIERYLSAAVPIKLQIHRLDEHEALPRPLALSPGGVLCARLFS